MPWLKVRFRAAGTDTDAFSARLGELGALAVTVTGTEGEVVEPVPNETPLWPSVIVEGLFAADANVAEIAAACGRAPLDATPLEDEDWSQTWRRDLTPRRFGRLEVVPSCSAERDVAEGLVRIQRDPGLAFGSGSHPTTALCLEWLAATDLVAKTVLDVGCGSGILSIAALALGAGSVAAVDHDPQALLATQQNATTNGVESRLKLYPSLEAVSGRYDLIIANIVSGVLIDMAPALIARLATDGQVLLSGILLHQVSEVVDAYGNVEFARPMEREDWTALLGRKLQVS